MFKTMCKLVAGTLTVAATVIADQIPLTLVSAGTVDGTSVFKADLTGIADLTQIGSITIRDDGSPVGGADGIFSGFDLDALFLDVDGNLATSADRYFATDFLFTAGSTRSTSLVSMQPNAAHPGPTFGSLNATTIDYATATLNSFDAVSIADVNSGYGFLTLGDGGEIVANFNPTVPVGASLYLMSGEVGGQQGEFLDAFVFVSKDPVSTPEPTTLLLLGIGLVSSLALRRSRK